MNCGALPENLVESILFGHEKGSFTGAVDRHLGKFQEANGGTLFLDEIGELPLDMQVKLLRVLQEGEVDAVGAKRSMKVDVRIISATNRDLGQAVADGRFREDLFYRLNVFPIEAPSLRDRREDIPALVEHFVRRFNVEEGKGVVGATAETLALLMAHDWPGNVRQLENAVYRAIVLADGPYLQPHDFPAISGLKPTDRGHRPKRPPRRTSRRRPRPTSPTCPRKRRCASSTTAATCARSRRSRSDLIQLAIGIYSGHMSEVARRLGIGRSTLYRKVREQGIEGMGAEDGDGDGDGEGEAGGGGGEAQAA